MGGHTPGPWLLDDPSHDHVLGDGYHVIDAGNQMISTFLTLADARLIAAAPDLLAALKAITELRGFGPDEPYGVVVRDVIAKAEGR